MLKFFVPFIILIGLAGCSGKPRKCIKSHINIFNEEQIEPNFHYKSERQVTICDEWEFNKTNDDK